MGSSAEVSLAALKSFQELVTDHVTGEGGSSPVAPPIQNTMTRGDGQGVEISTQAIWKTAWKVLSWVRVFHRFGRNF